MSAGRSPAFQQAARALSSRWGSATRPLLMECGAESRRPIEPGRRSLAADLGLFELGRSDRPVESRAQRLRRLERELHARPRPRIEPGVEEVECDDVIERRVPGMV